MYINVILVGEFQRWWVNKKQDFGQKINLLEGKNQKNLLMNVSSSKIGHDLSNNVVQKLTLKKILTKYGLLN
jgi:hypothetical protein